MCSTELFTAFEEKFRLLPLTKTADTHAFRKAEHSQICCGRLVFSKASFACDLVFCLQAKGVPARNLLDCRIYPDEREPFFIPLSTILLFLDEKNYISCDYPYLAVKEQLEQALEELSSLILSNFAKIEALFLDETRKKELCSRFLSEINETFQEPLLSYENGSVSVLPAHRDAYTYYRLDYYYRQRISRRIQRPLVYLPLGKTKKAYDGMQKARYYDKEFEKLIALNDEHFHFSSLQKNLYRQYYKSKGFRSLPVFFGSFLFLSLLFAPVALLLSGLFYFIGCKGFTPTIYHTSLHLTPFLLTGFSGILLFGLSFLCFDSSLVCRLLYGKEQMNAYYQMLFSKAHLRLMKIIGCIACSLLAVFSLSSGNAHIRFEEQVVTDSSAFFDFSEHRYLYSDFLEMAKVKDHDGRYRYVLVTKDWKLISLSSVSDEREIENQILNIIKEKNVPFFIYESKDDFQSKFSENPVGSGHPLSKQDQVKG